MDYNSAIEYLYLQLPMFSRVGAAAYKPGLDTVIRLSEFFGNPHKKLKCIHVAGTNGKGSTSHMIAAILQSAGYKTALYTSPHLVDFRERIRIDGKMIPRDVVADFVERFQTSGYNGHPSFFELTMLMAFDWFAREDVDYAVIEVGMGGRLDSTNIISPEACIITNISPDHTQFLGATLPEIAGEKAGIIKPGIPVVIGESEGAVREVFREKAAKEGAPIVFADDTPVSEACLEALDCPLTGDYQKHNINTVLHAVPVMRSVGIDISDEAVKSGIRGVVELTGLQGRWQILGTEPLVIADTGHNLAGLQSNMARLQRDRAQRVSAYGHCTLRFVIGFVADKDIPHILPLFPKDAVYYLSQAQIPRALAVDKLVEETAKFGLEGKAFATVPAAFEAAIAEADPADIIYVGGSTFIVADLLASMQNTCGAADV